MRDFTDGTSNTLMVSEVYRGKPFVDSGPATCTNLYRCYRWIGTAACEADASRPPNDNNNTLSYRPACGLADDVNWRDVAGGYARNGSRVMASMHEGGVHGLFADGSVNFISESVELQVLQNSVTRSGAETDNLSF